MISLVISSYCPKVAWLIEALDSAQGFDEIVLYCRGGRDRFAENVSYEQRVKGAIAQDESFNETKNILDKYILNHPEKNIRFYTDSIERTGQEAMNYFAELAKGEWIIHFGDDDKFIPENLINVLSKIKAGDYDDADIVFSTVIVNGSGSWGIGTENFNIDRLKSDNAVPFSSFIKKESFFKAGGYLNGDPITDWGLWLRSKMMGMVFRYFDKPIYDYRFTPCSTLNAMDGRHGNFGTMRETIIKNAEEFINEAVVCGKE